MTVNFIIFLVTTILLLGQLPKTKGDSYSASYENLDDQSNRNEGLRHTIHSLKGHYKEEAQRLLKCGGIDKKENKIPLTTKTPETEFKIATTKKPLTIIKSSTTQKPSRNENYTTTENPSTSEESTTIENPPANKEANSGKKSSNETLERTDTIVTTENLATLLLPISEKLEEANNNTILNDTNTPEINEADLSALSEILKDFQNNSLPSRRVNNEEEPIININSEKSSHPALEVNHDSVLDSTQKHFEFESLVIRNEANKDITNKMYHFLDHDKDDGFNIEKNDTRRFMPSDFNEGQFPINYYNPFASPPPRSYAAPINPNILKVQSISNNQIGESLTVNGKTSNSSEYKDSNKTEQVDEYDTDLLFKDPNISDEDLNRVASHPTKGFGISEMDKSNLMLFEHPRVCFACSSTNNPSCWSPDMRTPAKYCRRDHNACLTKTYKHRGYAFIVRDCGTACLNRGLGDLGLHYRSCTICHSDLCNGAHSTSLSLKTVIMLLISVWFKYT